MKISMKRIGAFVLALVMVIGLAPVVNNTVNAAVSADFSNLTDKSIGVSLANSATAATSTWSGTENTITGSLAGQKKTAKLYLAATDTLTITNNKSSKAKLSFDYTTSGNMSASNTVTIGGGDTITAVTSGSYEVELEAGSSITVVLAVKQSKEGTNQIGISITNLMLSIIGGSAVDATFEAPAYGSYTVAYGDESVTVAAGTASQVINNLPSVAYTLTATPGEGYKFVGWYNVTTGKYLSTATTYNCSFEEAATVKAVIVPAEAAVFLTGGNYYTDLNEAVVYATANDQTQITLVQSGTLAANDTGYSIPAGITLLIPMDADYTPTGFNSMGVAPEYTLEAVTPYAYMTLTLAEGASLTVNGTVDIESKHTTLQGAAALRVHGGRPSGAYGAIYMSPSSTITLNSGANLYAWGYVYGDGSITANSGSKVYEYMQVTDFPGGGNLANFVDKTLDVDEDGNGVLNDDQLKSFPFSQYYVQNIEVALTLMAGATESVFTTITAANYSIGMPVEFIGNNGMFVPGTGSITKDYDPSTDRLNVDVDGDATVRGIVMDMSESEYAEVMEQMVGSSKFDSSRYILTLNSNISINVNSGTTTVAQDIALFPGVEIYVGKDAIMRIAERTLADGEVNSLTIYGSGGYNVYVYDLDQFGKFVFLNTQMVPVSYSPTTGRYKRTAADLKDAVIDIDGKLICDGYLYSSVLTDSETFEAISGGAAIISSGKTGSIVFQNGSGIEEFAYCLDGTSSVDSYMEVDSAWLKNGDGTFVLTDGADLGTTYNYCAIHDLWYTEGHELCGKAVEITWIIDGEDETQEVDYNTVPVYLGTPTKAADGCTVYTFAGWATTASGEVLSELPKATMNAVYYAIFTEGTSHTGEVVYTNNGDTHSAAYDCCGTSYVTGESHSYTNGVCVCTKKQTFTVQWNSNGSTVETDTVEYGATAKFDGTAPTKTGHTFAGWEIDGKIYQLGDSITVKGDVTATATWTVNSYNITFRVNGDVTNVVSVPYGTQINQQWLLSKGVCNIAGYNLVNWVVTYSIKQLPNNYNFSMPAQDFYADANLSIMSYTVKWVVDGVTTTESYNYGATPSYKSSTDKAADNCTTYTFTGWDKELAAVTGNVTYTAVYEQGTEHVGDTDNDHFCNGCTTELSSCVDSNQDHKCDYAGCKATMSQCKDSNSDHYCDYLGCLDKISDCVDANEDHMCDYVGCKASTSECKDDNKDHECDYAGCDEVLSECVDGNQDHVCDYTGCNAVMSQCKDSNGDHYCDYLGCLDKISECKDDDKDHICDYAGCDEVLSECVDGDDQNHNCDYDGCNKANVDDGCYGGTADCQHLPVCAECGLAYGTVDPDNHVGEWDYVYVDIYEHKEGYACCEDSYETLEHHGSADCVDGKCACGALIVPVYMENAAPTDWEMTESIVTWAYFYVPEGEDLRIEFEALNGLTYVGYDIWDEDDEDAGYEYVYNTTALVVDSKWIGRENLWVDVYAYDVMILDLAGGTLSKDMLEWYADLYDEDNGVFQLIISDGGTWYGTMDELFVRDGYSVVGVSDGTTVYDHINDVEEEANKKLTLVWKGDHICSENLTHHEAATPDCQNGGNTAYYSCTCGKFYSDAAAVTEIAENSWALDEDSTNHTGTIGYTNNGDDHTAAYTCCGESWDADHVYDVDFKNTECICGAIKEFKLTIVYGVNHEYKYETMVPYWTSLAALDFVNNFSWDSIYVNSDDCLGYYSVDDFYWDMNGDGTLDCDRYFTEGYMPARDMYVEVRYVFSGWAYDGIGWQYLYNGSVYKDMLIDVYKSEIYEDGGDELEGVYMTDANGYRIENALGRYDYIGEWINGVTYEVNAEDLAYCESHGLTFIDADQTWYYFGEDGKWQYNYTGIVGSSYVINGQAAWHIGLVEVDGDYYYFTGDAVNGGNIMVTGDYYLSRNTTGKAVTIGGIYTFGTDGKLCDYNGITKVNGVLRYYEDARLLIGNGLTKVGENYIYVDSTGELVVNASYYIGSNELGINTGIYNFDENGFMVIPEENGWNGLHKVDGTWYYYINGEKGYCAGLIEVDGNWVYVRSDGSLATGVYYVTNTNGNENISFGTKCTFDENGVLVDPYFGSEVLAEGSTYIDTFDWATDYVVSFDADGHDKLVIDITGAVLDDEYDCVGAVVDVWNDDRGWLGEVFVEIDGTMEYNISGITGECLVFVYPGYDSEDNYYIYYGTVAYKISLMAGGIKNGIIGDYYYEDGQIAYGAGLIEIDGNYYYVRSNGQIVKDCQYWITNVNDTGYEPGMYQFDEDGWMSEIYVETFTGIKDGKYYIEDEVAYGAGLMYYNGGYIYVRSNGELATGKYWTTNHNDVLPEGYYDFGENGFYYPAMPEGVTLVKSVSKNTETDGFGAGFYGRAEAIIPQADGTLYIEIVDVTHVEEVLNQAGVCVGVESDDYWQRGTYLCVDTCTISISVNAGTQYVLFVDPADINGEDYELINGTATYKIYSDVECELQEVSVGQ